MVPDDKWLLIFASGIFVASFTLGYSVTTAFMQDTLVLPSNFQCTESAIVNGVAECVKYEKRSKP
jgi:hypothetical protein